MNRDPLRYYEFGPFSLCLTDRLLMRNGDVVSLTPKVIDTLILLLENCGHVVTKETLMERLWSDSVVEESSLTQNIWQLRKALAIDNSGQQYIETISKRGYRFVVDVREVIESEQANGNCRESTNHGAIPSQAEHRIPAKPPEDVLVFGNALANGNSTKGRGILVASLAGGLLLVSVLAIFWSQKWLGAPRSELPNSIAVLPFKTMGFQPESDLIGLGMADAVILRLTRLNRATVLPTSSIYRYTKREKDILSIGRELGVDAVLDGTVQRGGDRVRVTAVLVRTSDGKAIWSQKFDNFYTDVFALQDSISERVLVALMPSIRDATDQVQSAHITENADAYQDYLTGVYFWNRRTRDNLAKATHYLEQAVKKDDQFALAHAILADAYYLSFQEGYSLLPKAEALTKAARSVERALELDELTPEAHTVKAGIAFAEGNFDEAGTAFRRALDLNPSYALAHLRYGYFLFAEGKLDQAVAEMKRAVELDPVSPVSHAALGFMLYMSRDFDGALRENLKAIELQPDHLIARLNLANTYTLIGKFSEGQRELERLERSEPLVATQLSYLYAASGRTEEAARMMPDIKRSYNERKISAYHLAVLYAAMGNKDAAFDSLERSTTQVLSVAMFRFDPQLDALRDDERFNQLLRRPTAYRASK